MSQAGVAAELLEHAAKLIRRGEMDRAAWRVADAGAMIREALEADGHTQLIGLNEPTGRGVVLPRPQDTTNSAKDG